MNNDAVKIVSFLNIMELPIDKPISEQSIINAYRKMAKVYHPDAHISIYSDGAKFKELLRAKEYLLGNISYVNGLISCGFSQLNHYSTSDDDYERWKQEQEFLRRQKEEQTRKKAAEEAERKQKESEERARQEKERIIREEQARKKAIRERKERAIKDVTDFSQKYNREDYFEEDYNKIIQFLSLFFTYINDEKLSSVSDIDSHYNKLIEEIKRVKTIKQIEKNKKVTKRLLIIGPSILASCIVLLLLLFNVLIPNRIYNEAIKLINDGNYSKAEQLFDEIADYKDSKTYLQNISKRRFINRARYILQSNNLNTICSNINSLGGSIVFQYELDGGSINTSPKNTDGYYINANKDGYSFEYWSLVESSLNEDSLEVFLTLKANYEEIKYTIIYDLNGGIANNKNMYTINDSFKINNPTRDGCVFLGWTTKTNKNDYIKDIYIEKGSTGDLFFDANWQFIDFNISYTLNGGSANNPNKYNVENSFILLENPVMTGYTFLYWVDDNNKKYLTGFDSNICCDIHLTAVYTANKYRIIISNETYNISFYLNNGEDQLFRSEKVNGGESITYPIDIPRRENYYFCGWFDSIKCDNLYDFSSPIEDDINLYAGWLYAPPGFYIKRYIDRSDPPYHVDGRAEYFYFAIYDNKQFNLMLNLNLEKNRYYGDFPYEFSINIYNASTGELFYSDTVFRKNSLFEEEYIIDCSQYCKSGDVIAIHLTDSEGGYIKVSGIEKPKSTGVAVGSYKEIIVSYDRYFNINYEKKDRYIFLGYFDANGRQVTDKNGVSLEKFQYEKDLILYAKWIPKT